MKPRVRCWALIGCLWVLAGCTMTIDAPQTPTAVVLPTLNETALARLVTKTPTLTPTPTRTPTRTPTYTPTATVTATFTPTDTLTSTFTATTVLPTASPTNSPGPTFTKTAIVTATRTASPTATITASYTPTATSTQTSTFTVTPVPTQTLAPTATRTPTVTGTATSTPSPAITRTPAIALLAIPTATARFTATFTPFPTLTPNLTQTASVQELYPVIPTATRTPGGIYTLTPTVTSTVTIPPTFTVPPSTPTGPSNTGDPGDSSSGGDSAVYDPGAVSGAQDSLPAAPAGDSGPSGSPLPEQEYIVVSYEGQVVPILPLLDGVSAGSALAQGDVFAMSAGGAVASVGYDRWLYVNGERLTVSPSSEFGLHPNLSIGDLVWSPDGQRLAFRVDTSNPSDFNGIDSGIWIYEPVTRRSWQVFRNTYQAAQLHEQRRALAVQWSPNGAALVVTVETGVGRGNVFMPVDHDANMVIPAVPFADASWAPDSGSLVVSGENWDSQTTVVGRVMLDANWTYTGYLNEYATGLAMTSAIQLFDGRIAFLGSSQGSFALYTIPAITDAPVTRVSPLVPGQIASAEWNADRSAVLVPVVSGGGTRLWVIRTDGTARDTTPVTGAPTTAHWR